MLVRQRVGSYHRWGSQENNHSAIPNTGRSSSRKRTRTQKFMNGQGQEMIGQQDVIFHCPKCMNDFNYSSAETASCLFADHVRHCKPFDPNEVRTGARVIVMGKGGKGWQATIQKYHTQKGEPGFMIHYDGKKRQTSIGCHLPQS